MKIPSKPRHLSPTFPRPDSDLHHPKSAPRRKTRTSAPARLKRVGLPTGKRSRPETPLLKWKIDEGQEDHHSSERRKDQNAPDKEREDAGRRKGRKGGEVAMSARKLAAGLWRLQLPETVSGLPGRNGQLGFQPDIGHIGAPFLRNCNSKAYASEANDLLQSPSSTSRNGFLSKLSNSAMEGQTKWDPVCLKTSDEVRQIYSQMKLLDQQASATSVVSVLEAELEQARARIQELEMDRRSSKKKLEQFLRNVSEERVSWKSREHEKIRAYIDDVKTELNRERKNRQRTEILNSKLVNELADAKLSAKRYMQDYEKERKARELIEEVCDELAKEIGEDKAEVEALKRESMKLRDEVEDERKMLQMAEVWREERVQMKLVDAKLAVEEKYSLMNKLVADLEDFLRSRSPTPDVKEMQEAEFLRQAAAAVNIQEVKDFSYEPPNPDIFSVFEEVNFGEPHEREIEQCVAYSPASHASKIRTVSPEVNGIIKDRMQRHPIAYSDHNGDIEEDESGWETVSHLEDQGSSYSPNGSAPSVNKNHRESNITESETEWEENEENEGEVTPITGIEVSSVPAKQTKKVSSISRLWRSGHNNGDNCKIISLEGINGRLSNGRISTGGIISPDQGSGKGGVSPSDLVGQWSSPESGNHIRGMKGCIPLGAQKHSLKAKLLEARLDSQKVQLRHVLKQKI